MSEPWTGKRHRQAQKALDALWRVREDAAFDLDDLDHGLRDWVSFFAHDALAEIERLRAELDDWEERYNDLLAGRGGIL